MRTTRKRVKINQAKLLSLSGVGVPLILESRKQREFFRFEDGKLVEYDLTRSSGVPVSLSQEEKREAAEFISLLE